MSKSQYKLKGGRQRSRSAKPYEKNKNLVTKVKSWLTPSSWLSYWSSSDTCEDDPPRPSSTNGDYPSTSGDHLRNSIDPISHPEMNTPRPLFDNDQFTPLSSSEGTSLPVAQHTDIPSRSHTESDNAAFSTASSRDIQASFNSQVSRSRNLLAFGSSGNQDMSSSSNESWVAEDTEYRMSKNDPQPDGKLDTGITPGKRKRKSLETSPLSRTKLPTSDSLEIVEESAGVVRALTPVQAGGNGIEEHTVQLVSNPAFSNRVDTTALNKTPPKRKTFVNQSVNYSRKDTSGFSADFSHRLYSASAVVTSTPQLSPVHEQQEESMQQDGERATSPFNPVSYPPLSQSFNRTLDQSNTTLTRSLTAPSRSYTDESIRRSPFRSPFYSGRTSFGGASSGQRMRLKRPRTESSPPVLAPLRVSVRARPAPSLPNASTHQSVVSQTAKKIMDTLDSLSSPLTDARKLPMRTVTPDMQQAKRRRLTDSSLSANTILSPPPVTPLHTSTGSHSFTPQTQIVPNERTTPRKQQSNSSVNLTDGGNAPLPPSLVSTTTTTNSLAPKLKFSLPQFTSVSPSNQPSVLSGLTFSAPPRSQQSSDPPDRPAGNTSDSLFSDRSPQASSVFKPSFHSVGKIARRSRGARSRHSAREEEEEEEYVNPVAPPPQVGLSLGQGGSLPTFTFHAQLLPEKKSTSPKFKAPTLSFSQTSSSTSSFSFSNPTPVRTDARLLSTTAPKGAFGFSVPRVQSPSTTVSQIFLPANSLFSSSLPSASLLKRPPPPFLKTNQLTGPVPKSSETPKPCPPLKNMSVVDALKRPEYSKFLPSDKMKKTIQGERPKSSARDVVDLTNSEDEGDSSIQKESKLTNPLSKFAPAAGTWSCHVCLVNNPAKNLKCVACQADKIGSKKTQNKAHSLSGGFQIEPVNGSPQGMKIPGSTSLLGSATLKPLPQFGPPTGSWECGSCLINNKPTDEKCIACSCAKPAPKVVTATLKPLPQFGPPAGSWECGSCLINNKPTDEKCVACSSAKPAPKVVTATLKPLPQFGPPAGSWECGSCLINNKPTDEKCVACSTAKPAPKVSISDTTKDAKVATGLTKSVAQVTSSNMPLLKPLPTSAPPLLSWTCDVCLVPNKAENNKCIACTAPKPGWKQDSLKTDTIGLKPGASGGFSLGGVSLSALVTPAGKQGGEDPKKASGLVLGSSGGFKLSAGVSLGGATSKLPSTNILLGNTGSFANSQTNNSVESKSEPLKPASSESPFKQLTSFKPAEKSLFGAPTSTASGPSATLLVGSSTSLSSVSSSCSSLVGIKLGGNLKTDTPLTGIKFGGVPHTTSSSTPGIILGGTTSSNTPLTGITLGGTTSSNTPLTGITLGGTTSSNTPLTGIKLGGTTSSNTPLTGITLGGNTSTNTPLTGITLGGTTSSKTPLTGIKFGGTTSSNTPLTGITLGGTTSSKTPLTGITLGGTTSSNTPLTGITLGGGLQTSFNTNPLGGIKLGGTFPVPSPSSTLGNTKPSTTTLGTGLSTSTFVFGQTPTSEPQQKPSLPPVNTTGAQKQDTSFFKFTGATSANPLPGIPPSTIAGSSFGTGLSFGNQQTQPLSLISSTPLGAQTDMLSQDHDMNIEQDRSEQSQSLMFGTLKNQQSVVSSNIFGSQPQKPVAGQNAGFNFSAKPQSDSTREPLGGNMSNSIFKFGSGSSDLPTGFSFSGGTQKPAAESAKITGSGLKSSLFQPSVPNTHSSSTSGFNFGSSSEMNFNTAPSSAQNTSQSMFTVGAVTASTASNRVIKKARRRKPAQ